MKTSAFDSPGESWPPLQVRVVPYDPRWPEIFANERDIVFSAIRDVVEEVHHFGSTSVPGLAAKPIIDLCAVCRVTPDAPTIEALVGVGYVHRRHVADASLVFLGKGNHEFHLQVVRFDHPSVEQKLALRDYLRAHPESAEAYAAHKDALARLHAGVAREYALGKRDFVDALEARALEWVRGGRRSFR